MNCNMRYTNMYDTLKRIYKRTMNIKYLNNGVKKGWITEEEKEKIIHEVGESRE